MTAILHPLEDQREESARAFVSGILDRAAAQRDGGGWCLIDKRAPENVTLEFDVGSGHVLLGWCSFRFLRGHPTFWARLNGPMSPAEIVFPRRWREVTGGR